MVKKNEPIVAADEILRRLKLAEEWLPPIYTKPEKDKWKFVAAFLLQDEKIFSRFKTMSAPKKSGRPKVSAETKKYPPQRLISLANKFDLFFANLRKDADKKNISRPTQESAIKLFIRNNCNSLKWLPQTVGTIQNLIIQGRNMKDWPELIVDGKRRLVHPIQFRAITSIYRQGFLCEEFKRDAVCQILSLEYDRPGDLVKMQQWEILYALRELQTGQVGNNNFVISPMLTQIKVSTKN